MKTPSLTVGRGRMRRVGRHVRAILPGVALTAAWLVTAPPSRAGESGWEEAPADDETPPKDEPAPEPADEPAPEPSTAPVAPPVSSVSAPHIAGCDAPEETAPPPARPADIGAAIDLSYGRMVFPVADSTFSSSGWPDKKGRELGFQNPLAHVVGFRTSVLVEPHLGITFGMSFAWAHSDATGTDPVAQQTTGWLFATDFLDLGLEGIESVGPLTLRAGGSLGPRIVMLGMDHRSNNSNAVGAFEFYVRPRVAAELALGDGFAIGAYASDDILRTTSVGVGGYLSFRSSGFEQH